MTGEINRASLGNQKGAVSRTHSIIKDFYGEHMKEGKPLVDLDHIRSTAKKHLTRIRDSYEKYETKLQAYEPKIRPKKTKSK